MGMKVGHLGGKDELVPNTPLLRPLANELLRGSILTEKFPSGPKHTNENERNTY